MVQIVQNNGEDRNNGSRTNEEGSNSESVTNKNGSKTYLWVDDVEVEEAISEQDALPTPVINLLPSNESVL